METSQLNSSINRLTGFYMRGASVINGLNQKSVHNNLINPFQSNVSFLYTLKTSETKDFLMFSGGMEVKYLLKMNLKRIKSTGFNCTNFLIYARTGNSTTSPCNPPISLIELWEFNRTKIANLSNEDIISAINKKPLIR